MYRMTDEEFESVIAEALDAMPEQFMEALNNVAIVWEEEPSAYHLGYDEEWGIEPAFVEDEDGPESYTPAERDAKDDAAAEDAGGEYEAEDDEDEFDDLLGLFDGLSTMTTSPTSSPSSKAHTSAASTAARKSWKRSARPSSMSWATTSALTRTSWPPWGTSKGAGSPRAEPCNPLSERERAALSRQQVACVLRPSRQNIVVEALFPIDIVDALLHLDE